MDDFITSMLLVRLTHALKYYVHMHILPKFPSGQDTTASTLSFAAVLVHQHPEVLERLLAEIEEVLGNKTSVSAEDLENLKYAEQVNYPIQSCDFKSIKF